MGSLLQATAAVPELVPVLLMLLCHFHNTCGLQCHFHIPHLLAVHEDSTEPPNIAGWTTAQSSDNLWGIEEPAPNPAPYIAQRFPTLRLQKTR